VSAELLARAKAGDPHAFEALIQSRIGRLHATASLVLHDRTLAEDAVQEALVRAWRSLPRLRDPERFDAWLRRLLVHACIDAARGEKHERKVRELPIGVAAHGDFESAVAERDALARAFAGLTASHRAAFVLRHYFGDTVQEVADALEIPLGTAKSRLHYAEQAMSVALEAEARLSLEGGVA
jgi:RNA polymerase sigma-70 factor, ECF subfamily